ncbi:unnamed protein product [Dracunculus medinensis]|uniref:Protein kinase domain-containing protein n=1 Tax=Dracunculus medinensis TaxID=318479 RepID=A0A0N4UE35_DRAME|nr:unnamed protein product [Dracunculus medinensis]
MERFDNFEFNKNDVLGHGAFAIVYKGRYADKKEIPVAIKVIQKKHFPRAKAQSEDKKISLLEKEIKILKELANLKHENLVSLLRCHEVSNAVYLVMEYCNAGDLADYLNEKTTLPETTIQHFLRHMACAIEAIYKMGIVHRDLKPQNMLLCNPTGKSDPDPLDFIVKLADFGFARFLEDGVMAATLCGSPMYMAPEVSVAQKRIFGHWKVLMSHKYCAKADLWSLGTIIFQCLSSKPPFHAATPNELRDLYEMNRNLEPKIPAGCNPLLRDLLFRLLKRDAKDRIEFGAF